MLDIDKIRKDPDGVRAALATRGEGAVADLDRLLVLDDSWRAGKHEIDEMRARHKAASKEVGKLFQSGKREEGEARKGELRELSDAISAREEELRAAEEERTSLLLVLPNLPQEGVPVGADEDANREERVWGERPELPFEPRNHVELGESLGILDLPRASKLAGSRFPLFLGAGAILERALIQFMLDLHVREHGYTEVSPPFLLNADALTGTGQLPKFEEDLFRAEPHGYYLIPTAEVALVNLYREEILDADALPIRHVAYTPCFRSEAGAAGKDTKGIIRVHQFDKVELVQLTRPEDSAATMEEMTRHAETVLQRLGLHYRVVTLCTGEMGFAASRTHDLEVWIPSQGRFREVSSVSNCDAFQARRARIRYRPERDASARPVHALNGSGVALARTWVALVECNQQEDGSVRVPEALHPYTGGLDVIRPPR
jgi:seryl-tRNA synthetase